MKRHFRTEDPVSSLQHNPASQSSPSLFCGIDIGGTSVKMGLVDGAGALVCSHSVPTPVLDEAGCALLFSQVAGMIERSGHTRVAGMGIGVPGAVDARGTVRMMPNASIDIAALRHAASAFLASTGATASTLGLASEGSAAEGTAGLAVLNDANAAALGEQWAGAAKGARNAVLITLGTGVGAGIVCNGVPLAGAHGAAGEVGHLLVEPAGALCNCGGAGCLEQYASAPGLVRLANEAARNPEVTTAARMPAASGERTTSARMLATPSESAPATPFRNAASVFAALAQGNHAAQCAVDTFCDKLGLGLAHLACVVDPEIILIGGGLSHFFPHYAGKLRRAFARYAPPACRNTRIEPAALGNAAGTIGAARAAMQLARAR